MVELELDKHNAQLEHATTEEILRWTWETFHPKVATTSSFQTQSLPLLHIISRVCPDMPVLFIDTGFHFPETLTFRDELQTRYGLNVVVIRPAIEKSQLLAKYGEGLYRRDPDLCCYINKVEPMRRALRGLDAWIAGVRRDQTAHRKDLAPLERQSDGVLKIHPMLNWTKSDIWAYIAKHELPPHPLYAKGYRSIGCAPCTIPVILGEDERAGRWADRDKNECGLHLDTMKHREESNEK